MSKIDNIVRFGIFGSFLMWILFSYPNFYPLPQITIFLISFLLKLIGLTSVYYDRFLVMSIDGVNRTFNLSVECAGLILFFVFEKNPL